MMNKDENMREYSEELVGVVCDRTVNHEVSGEYTLPDYQPELRRLLSVTERILPPAKYVSHSGVECNGNIDYRILYVGVDGGLYSASLSSEYEFSAPLEGSEDVELSDGAQTVVSTFCDGTTTRVTSPRKINIKSRLSSHVRAYAPIRMSEEMYGGEYDSSIEKLYKDIENARVDAMSSDSIELTDEITGLSEDTRVISADAGVFVKDIRKDSEGVSVSGDVILRLLTCRDGQRAQTNTRRLPFSERLEWGEEMKDPSCRAQGNVTDITVNVEEGRILCTVSMTLYAAAYENRDCRYIADVYSTERECECETEELSLPVVGICSSGNFSQSERVSMSDVNIPEGANIIDAWCAVSLNACEYEDERYVFTGQSKYTLLCEKDGEYSVCELQLPVKYETSGMGGEGMSFDVSAEAVSCRLRIDGDTLCVDSEIVACVDLICVNKVNTVKSVRLGELHGKKGCRMVVYYPAEGESCWEVAKRYHVPAGSLKAEKNYYLF